MNNFIAFVRGMAMFKHRRIPLAVQENLLRRFLPSTVKFRGAFEKSGNYALSSEGDCKHVASAVLSSLRKHERLQDLDHAEVFVFESGLLRQAYQMLGTKLTNGYGKKFNPKSCGVHLADAVWRAGMTFLQEASDLQPSWWPNYERPRTMILGSAGPIVFFLKREEQSGKERRISFGDPTAAVDRAIEERNLKPILSTSRSLKTVRGVMGYRKLPRI